MINQNIALTMSPGDLMRMAYEATDIRDLSGDRIRMTPPALKKFARAIEQLANQESAARIADLESSLGECSELIKAQAVEIRNLKSLQPQSPDSRADAGSGRDDIRGPISEEKVATCLALYSNYLGMNPKCERDAVRAAVKHAAVIAYVNGAQDMKDDAPQQRLTRTTEQLIAETEKAANFTPEFSGFEVRSLIGNLKGCQARIKQLELRQPPQSADAQAVRDAFEEMASCEDDPKYPDGSYKNDYTQTLWNGFESGWRNALASVPQPDSAPSNEEAHYPRNRAERHYLYESQPVSLIEANRLIGTLRKYVAALTQSAQPSDKQPDSAMVRDIKSLHGMALADYAVSCSEYHEGFADGIDACLQLVMQSKQTDQEAGE